MESLEIAAKSVKEAIEIAVQRLGKPEEQLQISVLSEGSRGILGIGGEPARILVSPTELPTPTAEAAAAVAKEVLETILEGMEIPSQVRMRLTAPEAGGEPAPITLEVVGENMGVLIGRRGETLSCLQFITNLIVGRRLEHWPRVIVDVAGYRLRREQYLRGLAHRVAEQVTSSYQPVALEAMPAYERRVVHLALQNHPHVVTQSTGEGDQRKVVVMPRP